MNSQNEITKTVVENTENVLMFTGVVDEDGNQAFKIREVDQWLDYGDFKNPIVGGVTYIEQYLLLWPEARKWECHGKVHYGDFSQFHEMLHGLEY